jgi:hypothetical protein
MRLEERRTLRLVIAVGATGALIPVLYLSGLFVFGLSVAPRPVAETAPAPPLIEHALWARAEGGRANELRGINPISMAGYVACNELSEPGADCSDWLPAMPGLEYLANLNLRDHGVERHSFRGGAGALATTIQISQSWTREQFLHTLAARAQFDHGWRGVEAAAYGFFGRPAAAVTLPQAALIASRVGDLGTDPWCEPAVATAARNRILEKMRDNGAISDEDLQQASSVPLEFAPPSEARPPCSK